jgi:hypothetical protein
MSAALQSDDPFRGNPWGLIPLSCSFFSFSLFDGPRGAVIYILAFRVNNSSKGERL